MAHPLEFANSHLLLLYSLANSPLCLDSVPSISGTVEAALGASGTSSRIHCTSLEALTRGGVGDTARRVRRRSSR